LRPRRNRLAFARETSHFSQRGPDRIARPKERGHQRVFAVHEIDMQDDIALAREKARLGREFWPKFGRFAARLPFAEDLLAAYFCAFDRNTPRRVQVALIGALAYFVLPFDFVPDMLPFIGFTDDAAVLATAIKLVAVHITPQHREAARRVLERAAAPRPHSPAHAQER
jgi:uncharacterized membrane protein YkvA (DUF1232 family)